MAYSISQQNNTVSAYVVKYTADTIGDIADLPTNVAPGSTCTVISPACVYILNNDHQWVPFGDIGSGGGGSTGTGTPSIWAPF